MKVLMSGGGTAGHVAPLLAIIDEFKNRQEKIDIVFVGSKNGIEKKIMPQAGVRMRTIRCGKFRRYHSNKFLNIIDPTTIIKNLIDLKNFIAGVFDSLKILKEEDPDVVFLKGGFVTLPLGIACWIKGYPYFLHESDIISGLANRFLLKKAQKIFVSYPISNFKSMPKEKLIYSGNPIRRDILEGDKEKAYEIFGLDKIYKTILVIGGSQGAHMINMLIADKLDGYISKYQVIHISGDYDYDWLEHKSKNIPNKERYKLYNFMTGDLKEAYSVADIVVTRAGNNVLTELAALSKPAIIIPLESSANDHQLANAKAYSRSGAAYMMMQSHLVPDKLYKQVEMLLDDPRELRSLSEKISTFYKGNSSEILVTNIVNYYKQILREKERNNEKKGTRKSQVGKNKVDEK